MVQHQRTSLSLWKMVSICLLVILAFRVIFISNYVVEGHSMNPTLSDGHHVSVNTLIYTFQKPERFDIVVFQQGKQNQTFVKRVVGLPGEKLEYKNDTLYINDQPVHENFLKDVSKNVVVGNFTGNFSLKELTGKERVPKGHVFVVGDNRLGSFDSRHFGFVKIEDLIGKANVRTWRNQ